MIYDEKDIKIFNTLIDNENKFYNNYMKNYKKIIEDEDIMRDDIITKYSYFRDNKIIENKCGICNENLKDINIRWLISCKCEKLFHDRCLLDRWNLNKNCPYCKNQHKKNKKYFKDNWDYRFIMNNKEVKAINHGDDFIED